MTRVLAVALVVSVLFAPAGVAAKGTTMAVELRSPALAAPIMSHDAQVRTFEVWSGPGTASNGVPGTEGFIANWKAGSVTAPLPDLPRYDALFFTGCEVESPSCGGLILVYVVTYVVDPATRQGYVYIPGETETLYAINGNSIFRGSAIEGRWFRATPAWDSFAATLLSNAAR